MLKLQRKFNSEIAKDLFIPKDKKYNNKFQMTILNTFFKQCINL